MSMDSTDPTREPGTAGDAKAGVPHLRAPGGPQAPGTHGATQAPQPSPHGEAGPDPRTSPDAGVNPRQQLVPCAARWARPSSARRPP